MNIITKVGFVESSEHYLWRAVNVTTEVGFVESSNSYDCDELEL